MSSCRQREESGKVSIYDNCCKIKINSRHLLCSSPGAPTLSFAIEVVEEEEEVYPLPQPRRCAFFRRKYHHCQLDRHSRAFDESTPASSLWNSGKNKNKTEKLEESYKRHSLINSSSSRMWLLDVDNNVDTRRGRKPYQLCTLVCSSFSRWPFSNHPSFT